MFSLFSENLQYFLNSGEQFGNFSQNTSSSRSCYSHFKKQWITVGGVLKTSWIDLIIPINFIICNFYLYIDKFGQSWIKFHFFWFYTFWMQTVFLGIIWFFFVKLGFFLLFLVHFLYGKNTKYWKIIAEMFKKTVCIFPWFFHVLDTL